MRRPSYAFKFEYDKLVHYVGADNTIRCRGRTFTIRDINKPMLRAVREYGERHPEEKAKALGEEK